MTRRDFLIATTSSMAMAALPHTMFDPNPKPGRRIPEESEPHERTYMALAHSKAIWEDLLPGVQADQIRVANMIGEFEPVVMLVRTTELKKAKKSLSSLVEVVEVDFDDLWIRDFGPQFLLNEVGKLESIDLRFNGWGNKQTHKKDRTVAQFLSKEFSFPIKPSTVVMEGGAVEVNGKGTMIATKSCIVNKNRNPNRTLGQIDAALKSQFNLKDIVWLDGIEGRDITDGHTDFYARFLPNGDVLANLDTDPSSFDRAVTRKHKETLQKLYGRNRVKTVSPPTQIPRGFEDTDFAGGYINYYVINGAVIMPEFGDAEADEKAINIITSSYPGREVVPMSINYIAAGGGGIHCATLHQPKAKG